MNNVIVSVPVKIYGDKFNVELRKEFGFKGSLNYYMYDIYDNCESLRGYSSPTIEEGIGAIEYATGKKFTPEYRAILIEKDSLITE